MKRITISRMPEGNPFSFSNPFHDKNFHNWLECEKECQSCGDATVLYSKEINERYVFWDEEHEFWGEEELLIATRESLDIELFKQNPDGAVSNFMQNLRQITEYDNILPDHIHLIVYQSVLGALGVYNCPEYSYVIAEAETWEELLDAIEDDPSCLRVINRSNRMSTCFIETKK